MKDKTYPRNTTVTIHTEAERLEKRGCVCVEYGMSGGGYWYYYAKRKPYKMYKLVTDANDFMLSMEDVTECYDVEASLRKINA